MEKELDEFKKIFSDRTKNTSDVARQIVFALFAVIWAISYDKGSITFKYWSFTSLIILISYLVLDIFQSMFASDRYRKIYFSVFTANSLDVADDKEEEIESFCRKTDIITYRILIVKILLIPISLIGIVIDLISLIK